MWLFLYSMLMFWIFLGVMMELLVISSLMC